ncbi:class I SAM-dependent methyltransferase [Micromonospora endophytica]|uniref:Class I SAM-dependent methyltransferase n=1 Tax=Micromonospora endophytica TaxID=515350 RepID=A0A2W2DG53_9ACTN|nr:class I SAM-dependent methyltransferase [Micromonospora endophytica]PZF98827.1 class I SAM-dependent methyltransferase [Micromonospora endophytica]RIW46606.1 SAM-dependent methyltransferase [Micromonospora endophytica]BCJ59861.1 putative methyltransferase [Micromonospora endophytica]
MTEPTEALSFGAAAADYDRFRPRYPRAALRWALTGLAPPAQAADRAASGRPRVVDLAAGTGILTRDLLSLGHQVTAVEPDPGMRAQLAAATADVRPLAGSAESMPLPDGYADAVLAGQAYHWFDRTAAHPEIARVLRPGGVFAPIWNLRDDQVTWVTELSRIAEIGDTVDHLRQTVTDFGDAFGPLEWAEFTHTTELTRDDLRGLIRTRSHYLTATPQRRADVDREVHELLDTHPDLAGQETVKLPYRTLVARARRT